MLNRLSIQNIALIDKSEVMFDSGFSALTGETGAGKSILIESVGFVLGDRSSRESIRTGAAKATVEAEFTLAADSPALAYLRQQELDDGNSLIVYRELSQSGRNVCRVNGTLVSAAELKTLGAHLVDLHGQHAHQALLDPETHIRFIDVYAKDPEHLAEQVAAAREETLRLLREWKQLESSLAQRMQRIDMLRFQIAEIDRFDPKDGEEEELDARRNVLRNAETITEGLNAAYESLFGDGGVLTGLSEARDALTDIGRFDPAYRELSDRTDESYYTLEDVAYALRDARASFTYDPEELESIESRLASLQTLKRKYGASIAEILSYRQRIGEELALLADGDNQAEAKAQRYRASLAQFASLAKRLSDCRKAAAKRLCDAALREMRDMGMPNARFETAFREIPAETLSENGVDEVEFLLSANHGEPVKPLLKVASGGEISRIMLAMKIALSDADRVETLIFDEIDTGISGLIANAVARKMYELSKRHQVLCVTHLPQIAAYADAQYVASKESDATTTRSNTRRIPASERAAELARIMGSESSDEEALAHAKRLLADAEKTKRARG